MNNIREDHRELLIYMDKTTVKFGFIDTENNIVIPPIYEGVWPFDGNYAKVSVGKGKRGLIDRNGIIKVPLAYKDLGIISEDAAVVIDNLGYHGIIDITNGYQLPCIFDSVEIIGRDNNGFLICLVSDGWDSCNVILNENPVIGKNLVTKDCIPEFEGLTINRRIKEKKCDKCGGRLAAGYYCSSPESWAHLAGREGYLTICIDCGKMIDFECYKMN